MVDRYICGVCGFEAHSASGLSGHKQLTHTPGGSSHFRSGAIEERLTAIHELLTTVLARIDAIAPNAKKIEEPEPEKKAELKKSFWDEVFGVLP